MNSGSTRSERLDTALLAIAAIVLGYALQIKDGFYTPTALALVLVSAALAVVSVLAPRRRDERQVAALLLAGLAVNLGLLFLWPPGQYLAKPLPTDHPVFIACLIVAAALLALMARDGLAAAGDPRRVWRVWFPAVLATFAVMGMWMIDASPKPHIDVLTVHKFAIAALRVGMNPYAINFPNIYGTEEFYSPEMTAGQVVLFGLPYPPLSLLMAMPGQIWGRDIRYAELVSLLAGAGFIGYARRSVVAPLAAVVLLLTPRGLFVLEQGWTESFAIVWLGASVFAACRMPRALPWTLALLVAVKQHLVLAMPFALLLLPRPLDWRAAARLLLPSLVLPALLALPFVIWNAEAFLRSVVWLQLVEPFRADSLSVLSFLADQGWKLERDSAITLLAPLLALALGLIVAWRRAPRTPAGFAAALGLTLLLLFAASKKAFCNYYFFVIAALCAAIAADAVASRRDA